MLCLHGSIQASMGNILVKTEEKKCRLKTYISNNHAI